MASGRSGSAWCVGLRHYFGEWPRIKRGMAFPKNGPILRGVAACHLPEDVHQNEPVLQPANCVIFTHKTIRDKKILIFENF